MALGLLVVPVMLIIVIVLFIRALKYNKKKHTLATTIIHFCIFMGSSFVSAMIFGNSLYYFGLSYIFEILINAYMILGFILSIIWLIITIKKQKRLSNEVKEEMAIKEEKKETKKENQVSTNNNEITLKINTKTLLIIGGGIMGFIIIILLIVLIFKGNGGNSATHDRITLSDSNINDYITVQLSGRLTDYSNNSFKGVHLSGNITSSLNGSQCENVSFKLKMSISYDYGSVWSYNGSGHDDFEERIFLDSGCNYSIGTSKKLSSSAKSNSASYFYDISDVKGSIIVPKKIVE